MASSNLNRKDVLKANGSSQTRPAGVNAGQYPLFRAAGSPRELGRQHGEQAAGRIKLHVDVVAAENHLSHEKLRAAALAFQPLFATYCPHLLDELRGLAEGAGITLAEALAVNIRGELGHAPQQGCTTYAISGSGTQSQQVLAGQNSDIGPHIPPLGYVLHLQPQDKPEVLMWTFGGMIGYHGMNSAGVAHFANSLFGEGPAVHWGMPHYPLKRLMLECHRVDEVIELFTKIPIASNANYVVCDGHGAVADIEATTAGAEVLRNDRGFVAHTNHYVCSRYASPENFPADWRDSFPRLQRIDTLVQNQYGRLTVDDIKAFLSDHSGYPASICRHAGESVTVASLIAEPAERRLHVSFGNPCQNPYTAYSM